ncbi:hypothetical protein VW41_12350 [Klebsiella michiganensis]|nr:hypothetical protein VW41_12350 [Klebsiella michiganensis]
MRRRACRRIAARKLRSQSALQLVSSPLVRVTRFPLSTVVSLCATVLPFSLPFLAFTLADTLIPYPPEPTPVPTPTLPPWLLLLPLTVSVFDAEDSRTSREALSVVSCPACNGLP